jgi:hypothetical protein
MQRGVCSKAIPKGEELGYCDRNLQWGLHGKHRKQKDGSQKLEYPGLLVRGIVFVVGGHPRGGLAPGGGGLTPDYAINRDVMLTFIPDGDQPSKNPDPEKGDTMGVTMDETKGETFSKRGETKGVHAHPSSPSSSLNPSAAGAKTEERSPRAPQAFDPANEKSNLVDVVGETADIPLYPPSGAGIGAGNEEGVHRVELAAASGSDTPIYFAGTDPDDGLQRLQADMHLTTPQICAEFKNVFDQLRQRRVIDLIWKTPLPKHQKFAAYYFKSVGRDVALAKWGEFLPRDNHEVTQPIYHQDDDDYTGETRRVIGSDEVQQDWLLYLFLKEETGLEAAPKI